MPERPRPPTRAVEELHHVAATRTERRQAVKVDCFRVADEPPTGRRTVIVSLTQYLSRRFQAPPKYTSGFLCYRADHAKLRIVCCIVHCIALFQSADGLAKA